MLPTDAYSKRFLAYFSREAFGHGEIGGTVEVRKAMLKDAIDQYVKSRDPFLGLQQTDYPMLGIFRETGPTHLKHSIYYPSLCAVVQGAKQVIQGDRVLAYQAGQALVISLDMPAVGRVTHASPEVPYLAVALAFDSALLQEVLEQLPHVQPLPEAPGSSLAVHDLSPEATDCLARLVRTLETPVSVPILFPSILRELYYHLLSGPRGAEFARLASPGTHIYRIAKAAQHLRRNYVEPVRVEELAAMVGMSVSSFHTHFKAATGLSPLQFQKQLRLVEARRLLLSDGVSAAEAALRVGYESASQFSREYARMFGAPPRRSLRESA